MFALEKQCEMRGTAMLRGGCWLMEKSKKYPQQWAGWETWWECRGPLCVFGQRRGGLIMICKCFGEGQFGESPPVWQAVGCGAPGTGSTGCPCQAARRVCSRDHPLGDLARESILMGSFWTTPGGGGGGSGQCLPSSTASLQPPILCPTLSPPPAVPVSCPAGSQWCFRSLVSQPLGQK